MSALGRVRASLCLLCTILLASCASAPDYAAMQAEGAARQVPVLINDTSWNDPHGWPRQPVDVVPAPGSVFVEILNTHSQVIQSIAMRVRDCGAKGSMGFTHSLTLTGPFEPGKSYRALPYASGVHNSSDLLPWDQLNHMVFIEVKVLDVDGKVYDYGDEVKKVLTSNIANFCSNNPW